MRVYAGRDPLTDRERYLKKTVDDEKQAEAALTKLLNQVDEQRHPRTQVTVRQVIAKWFEVVVDEEGTRAKNEQLVRGLIEPSLAQASSACARDGLSIEAGATTIDHRRVRRSTPPTASRSNAMYDAGRGRPAAPLSPLR